MPVLTAPQAGRQGFVLWPVFEPAAVTAEVAESAAGSSSEPWLILDGVRGTGTTKTA